jgi:hypothetical protein
MNRFHIPIICLIASSIVVAVFAQETSTNDWHPNTKLLDSIAKQNDPFMDMGDAGSTLARDAENFYQLLHDKKWHETYELHAKAFREDNRESDYLTTAKKIENKWSLVNYEILNVQFYNSYGSTNTDEAILICKFKELRDYEDSYSTVYWHKEDGVWKCLSAGPSKFSIFEGATRPPIIDWR